MKRASRRYLTLLVAIKTRFESFSQGNCSLHQIRLPRCRVCAYDTQRASFRDCNITQSTTCTRWRACCTVVVRLNTQLGFFADLMDADRFINTLEQPAADPTRQDFALQIGNDIDEEVRTCEVRNVVKHLVMLHQQRDKRKKWHKWLAICNWYIFFTLC